MGKRKSLNYQRFKWTNAGKKRRDEEEDEEVVVEEQIEEEEVVVEEQMVEEFVYEMEEQVDEEVSYGMQEEVQLVVGYAEAQNDDGSQQVYDEEMDEDEEQMDGVAPQYIYIEGVASPTRHLVDPRNGDGMVLELDSEDSDPYLASFNGDYHDLHQIVGAVWEKENNVEQQVTIGRTNRHPRKWVYHANRNGLKFVERPTMRTKACRSVITAIKKSA